VKDYHQVATSDFAIAVPVLADGRSVTLWQYKHGAGRVLLTFFPARHMVSRRKSRSGDSARTDGEDTGYRAAQTIFFGSYVTSGNQRCNLMHLFVLTGCVEPDHDDLET
jgi:ADP-ribose pyrophosphatase